MADSKCAPGEFFVQLYLQLEQASPHQRTACGAVSQGKRQEIARLLLEDDGTLVVEALIKQIAALSPSNQKGVLALQLAIARELDTAFYAIHPRARNSTLGKTRQRQSWLARALDNWYATGVFLEHQGRRLIPRGPLDRAPRDEHASSADTLADRFAALSVTGKTLDENGRHIEVHHHVVPVGGLRGVGVGSTAGQEKVAFLAVAQEATELCVEPVEIDGVQFMDFKAAPTLDVPTRVMDGLREVGQADIVMAPELLISHLDADAICAAMAVKGQSARLFVAGSGHTQEFSAEALAWNEARVLNQFGADLWRQRKLWQASVDGKRCADLGAPALDGTKYLECNASGDLLRVVDILGLGRCVILICQDLHAPSLVPELLRQYQPDWILVPIMDADIGDGRWAHRSAFGVSHHSRARFLLATNTAYARRLGSSGPTLMGMALGPAQEGAGEASRLCAVLPAENINGIELARVQWGSGCPKWAVTQVGLAPGL